MFDNDSFHSLSFLDNIKRNIFIHVLILPVLLS